MEKSDFLQRLQDLKDKLKDNPDESLTEDMITAQGIIFFVAGNETSANCLATLTYHLAKNPEVQERLFQEIRSAMEKNGGRIDHEAIAEMPYLEAALEENMRINGPVTEQIRLCTKDCQV